MRNAKGLTPKEAAADILIGWLRNVFEERTSDIERTGPPSFQAEVRKHIAKLHNVVLDKSGLDGTPLEG